LQSSRKWSVVPCGGDILIHVNVAILKQSEEEHIHIPSASNAIFDAINLQEYTASTKWQTYKLN